MGQINFLVPAGAQPGPGNISVTVAGQTGMLPVQIARISPGLYAANGAAVGNVLHLETDGTQSYTSLLAPIQFGVPGERVFLVIYATGIRGVSSLAGVTVTVGGQNVNVLYAGAQGTLSGLDQINVELPASMSGFGAAQIQVTADGVPANPVGIVIQ